jgi:hypothetical protein
MNATLTVRQLAASRRAKESNAASTIKKAPPKDRGGAVPSCQHNDPDDGCTRENRKPPKIWNAMHSQSEIDPETDRSTIARFYDGWDESSFEGKQSIWERDAHRAKYFRK